MSRSSTEKAGKWLWTIPIFLISLVYILDFRYFKTPPLRSDDWNLIIEPAVFNPLKAVQIYDRRPFQRTLLSALTKIFQLNIQWYYVANWLILLLSAGIVYLIIRKAFPKYPGLALPVAAITLVYPVSFSNTWLNILSNNFAFLISLLAILSLILYAQRGNILLFLLAIIAALYALLAYEASLGVLILTPVLLAVFCRKIPNTRRIVVASFLLTSLFYLIWRTSIQPNLLDFQDFYLASMDISLATIFSRYLQAGFIFIFNWIGILLLQLGDKKYWVFVMICGLAIILFLSRLPATIKSARTNERFNFAERKGEIKTLSGIALIGLLYWIAGYVPVITLWNPTFYGDGTRVNYSSIPGAALALVAGLSVLIVLFLDERKNLLRSVYIAVIPFLVFGLINQVHAQNIRFGVWEINKSFWQKMFQTIPKIRQGTKVVIVVPGYDDLQPFEMLPFRGDWEAESALRVLYNEPALFAEYYYIDLPALPDNWVPTEKDLNRLIFVYYDIEADDLRIIEDPAASLGLPLDIETYHPLERITDFSPEVGAFRHLVD